MGSGCSDPGSDYSTAAHETVPAPARVRLVAAPRIPPARYRDRCACFSGWRTLEARRYRAAVDTRCNGMPKSIYVGNLPSNTSEEEVGALFARYGTVHSVKLVTDRETGRARDFGFVEMETRDAETAIGELNGASFQGRALRVNEARGRIPREG
ncbi:RNA recognition motif [bacterium BMS3Bbin12]|nr:RNA recognition motif [bacterium BMS3Abin12]GBE47710.1 RNA recognition motif [bacterium BMS3Bbin12]GBE49938.1 RNA recognition motif [bacterium BMS3Bbin13]